MEKCLNRNDRLVVIRAAQSIIEKKLELIAGNSKNGGYETSILIAPRQGYLFNKTVEEAKELLADTKSNKNVLRTIGYLLRDIPEFKEFEGLYPKVNTKSDFADEVVVTKPIDSVIKSIKVEEVDLYEGWEQTLHDNKYHVNSKRNCRFIK